MLNLDTTLYFSSISYNGYLENKTAWDNIYNSCPPSGQFFINISKKINPCRFITRNGEWSLPWKQELIPGFEMPAYDPTFSKSFAEVTDAKALTIKQRIQAGDQFAVMYSGGVDSTVIMASLIKNLTVEELTSVYVCGSIESIIENPSFWQQFIFNKFTILDSHQHKFDDLIEKGLNPIAADEGDCLFGTMIGLELYNKFDYYAQNLTGTSRSALINMQHRICDPEVHFTQFKDLIIEYLALPGHADFGRLLYEKYLHNVNTATVPINSLHDFFWWLIFNVKYLNCSVRGALYYNDRVEWSRAITTVVNWFNDPEYQRWSMVNNNNGLKIKQTPATYRAVAKDYIWEFDHNTWYRDFKPKIGSLGNILTKQNVQHLSSNQLPAHRAGLTKDYQMLYITDPAVQEYYKHHLQNYTIDWTTP